MYVLKIGVTLFGSSRNKSVLEKLKKDLSNQYKNYTITIEG